MSQNPNYNPYNPNPSDPNQNPGTSYGAPPPPPPHQGSNPNYNPYPVNPPTPGPGTPPPPNTNYDPYNPYQANPTVREPSGPGSSPNYYPYGSNDPTVVNSPSNPNYASYAQQPSTGVPPIPPVPSAPPQRPRRTGRILAIIGGVVVLLVIAGIILVVAANNNATTAHTNATETANASTAQANTAATAHANATANAIATTTAIANATATAIVTSSYPPFTKLAVFYPFTSSSSDWPSTSTCQFAPNGFQVSIQQASELQECLRLNSTFGDFAYQVTMTIQQGDCGGLLFRYIDNNNFFRFDICGDGTYNLYALVNNQYSKLHNNYQASSAIHQGSQPNVVAITVQGDTVNMFVNGSHIDTATDSDLTTSQFSKGIIGLEAVDNSNPTTIVYTNALVWTTSS
ncbi:MAG TPA: hypothetical protein VKV20_01595 [Ktedonobacteraceae bacterium]|nr:hypothetical protein [Ktedonobacteraceae bacterium]